MRIFVLTLGLAWLIVAVGTKVGAQNIKINGRVVETGTYLVKKPLSIEKSGAGEKTKWVYGDETFGQGFINTHSYDNPGTYTLIIGEETAVVHIVPYSGYILPGVKIFVNGINGRDVEGDFSREVVFRAEAATGSAQLVKYDWDFGNGRKKTGQEVRQSYSPTLFDADVSLLAWDENGLVAEAVVTVVNKTVGPEDIPVWPSWVKWITALSLGGLVKWARDTVKL